MKRAVSKDRRYKKARWTENQKLEAVVTYSMLGSLKETCLVTSIPFDTLKTWKTQDWWKDLILQVRDEDVQQLDANLQRVINKALKATEDRIDNGDFQYDPKTGELLRVPVKAQIALKVTSELLTKQEKLRNAPIKAEIDKTVDARLAKLAEEFARFSKARTIDQEPESVEILTPLIGIVEGQA